MRTLMIATLAITGLGLSGCSQISSLWKKSADSTVENQTGTALRTAPQQAYQFDDDRYEVELYTNTSRYAGYDVEIYGMGQAYQTVEYSDPRQVEFVKLNGESEATDWRNCETRHRGYLFMSEYDFLLDPNFEVCMRNKGYVMTTEAGPLSKQTLTAQSVGLRGYSQGYAFTNSYPQP